MVGHCQEEEGTTGTRERSLGLQDAITPGISGLKDRQSDLNVATPPLSPQKSTSLEEHRCGRNTVVAHIGRQRSGTPSEHSGLGLPDAITNAGPTSTITHLSLPKLGEAQDRTLPSDFSHTINLNRDKGKLSVCHYEFMS